MNVVTAANSVYFKGLKNLVGSIHFWNPDVNITVFDLGIEYRHIKEIITWKNTALIHNWIGKDLPAHCKSIHTYAWKPIVLHHAISNMTSLLWIDAGSDIRARLTQIKRLIHRDGHFFAQGQDHDMTLTSCPDSYLQMDTRIDRFEGKPHFAGSIQGYRQNSQAHREILNPLYKYALIGDCIAPKGSNLTNHRFDQTLLSVLIYRSGLPIQPHTRLLASRRADLQANPFTPSRAIVYTARCSSREYVGWIQKRSFSFDRQNGAGQAADSLEKEEVCLE